MCGAWFSLPVITLGRPRNGYRRFSGRSSERGGELSECGSANRSPADDTRSTAAPTARPHEEFTPGNLVPRWYHAGRPSVMSSNRPSWAVGLITKAPGKMDRGHGWPACLVGQLGGPVDLASVRARSRLGSSTGKGRRSA